ncbi:MAG: vitamin B12-dependent ribonucleotide reductase [Candidatus Theseobacter exili]|nr:vitamin B12-dependent ribonucleotide reductase [Candidatus Theseobacter exili]
MIVSIKEKKTKKKPVQPDLFSSKEKTKKVEEMTLSANSLMVLEKRYLMRDENGNVTETPESMFRRVADNIAEAEKLYKTNTDINNLKESFYEIMHSLDFLPNSPTLMNAGRDLQQLSACFVLPIGDSMEEIFDTVKNTAILHKSGGGTGFSFSRLRPRNDLVKTTKGVSSGPVSFMGVINAATEAVKQGGTRRGANMGILRIDHPSILEFIRSKEQTEQLTNFNISVALTDKFMEALNNDDDYPLINPRTGKEEDRLRAREVYDLIVEKAWQNGEPGVVFIDRINRDNPTPDLGEIESTNPCGEQPLLPYESCNLGSINLSRFVRDKKIDYERLGNIVIKAVRFLDDVIDVNHYPLQQIEKVTKGNRKIGLGVMGFADLLIDIGIPYDSEEAVKTAEEIMAFIQQKATDASVALAKERGSFPNFSGSLYDKKGMPPLRNGARTTIAPTGTISMIADCSSGIEPLFALVYVKQVMDGNRLLYVNRHFESVLRERGIYSKELMQKIAASSSLKEIEKIPPEIRRLFVTAHDISPEWHVRMQAAFQNHIDNAVSKTINFPKSATKGEVDSAYRLAYEKGCKGITIYRDGSRQEQVLQKKEAPEEEKQPPKRKKRETRVRPEMTTGATRKIGTGCGNLYVTINEDETGPFEVFASLGKAGGCASSQIEAISRLISLSLRSGIEVEAVLKQLQAIRCPSPLWQKGGMVLSCPDAIGKAIKKYLADKDSNRKVSSQHPKVLSIEEEPKQPEVNDFRGDVVGTCPDCGAALEYLEGCASCRTCGYSKCG